MYLPRVAAVVVIAMVLRIIRMCIQDYYMRANHETLTVILIEVHLPNQAPAFIGYIYCPYSTCRAN